MACRPILSLIANQKVIDDQSLNISSFDDVTNNGYTHHKSGLFKESEITTKRLVQNKSVLEVGSVYLNDLYDLNINKPKEFDLVSISNNDVSVINMPTIEDISENIYLEMIKCNFYADKNYDFVGLDLCTPFDVQEKNYLDYANRIIPKYNFTVERLLNFNGTDTPIGQIGKAAAIDNLTNNAISHVIVDIGEVIETDLYTFTQNRKIFKHSYDISVPKTGIGKILNGLEKILGYQNPISFLPKDMFDLERTLSNGKSDEDEGDNGNERLAIQLAYTGVGQKRQIVNLLSILKYHPLVIDDKYGLPSKQYVNVGGINRFKVIIDGDKFNVAYTNNTRSNPSYIRNGVFEKYKPVFSDDKFSNDENFYYEESTNPTATSTLFYDKDSLLGKTDRIINEKYDDEKNIYSKKRSQAFINPKDTEYKEDINGKNQIISKGDMVTARSNMVIRGDGGFEEYTIQKGDFIRVWSKLRKHDRLNRAISHRTLDLNDKRSVLNDNGLINFAPTFRNRGKSETIKNYMLSIENLAWSDNIGDLPLCEIGKGDIINEKKGRIMWFPPYDLHFNESVSANYTSHSFIGRGEDVYTYNNTKRSGSLSFTMIMDYPDILNKVRGIRTEFWERYFKGDELTVKEAQNFIKNNLNGEEQEILNKIKNRPFTPKKTNEKILNKTQQNNPTAKPQDNQQAVLIASIYFPNEVSDIPDKPISENGKIINNAGYQSGKQVNLNYTYKKGILSNNNPLYINKMDYGLNSDFYNDGDSKILSNINSFIDKGYTKFIITSYGYTSQASPIATTNAKLGLNRAINLESYVKSLINNFNYNGITFEYVTKNIIDTDLSVSAGTGEDSDRNSYKSVYARRAVAYIEPKDLVENTNDDNTINTPTNSDNLTQDDNVIISNPLSFIQPNLLDKLLYTDCNQFDYMETYDRAFYETISERIKYFSPAYHSMTPQGFHTRLTFLHQCTRQGSSVGFDGIDNISNLAFGKPPVCILRVGDFLHSKIIINSLNIDYNDKITWDLNPEGVGVTPMIAKISLNFDYIGGQSMSAPISRLQNALSFNYYANTEMYDPRADKIIDENGYAKVSDGLKSSDYYINNENIEQSQKDYQESVTEKINVLNLQYQNYNVNESNLRVEDRTPKNNIPSNTENIDKVDLRRILNFKPI